MTSMATDLATEQPMATVDGMGTKKKHPGFRKFPLARLVDGSDAEKDEARDLILDAYRKCGGTKNGTAQVLEIAPRTIHRYIEKLDLEKQLAEVTAALLKAGKLDEGRHDPATKAARIEVGKATGRKPAAKAKTKRAA